MSHVLTDDEDNDVLFQVLAGEMAGHQGDLGQAVDFYVRAAQLTDDPQVAARATRIALYAGEDVDQALEAAKRWVQLQPESLEAQQTLAILYIRRGDTENAIPHLEQVLQGVGVEDGRGFVLIAMTLSKEKNADNALDAMQALVGRHERNPYAQYAYASLAQNQGRNEEAVAAATRAMALKQGFVEALSLRSRAYLQLGQPGKAIRDMQTAVALRPKDFEMQVNFGRLLVRAERYDDAQAVFEKLLKSRPDNEDLLYTLGLLNLQTENYAGAERYFRKLAGSQKRSMEGYYYLGRVAGQTGRPEQALGYYREVRYGEYFVDAQSRAAEIVMNREGLDKARAYLNDMRGKASDRKVAVKLYLAEGSLLREARQYEAGVEMYNRALTEHPQDGDLLYARALMAEKIGRIDLLERDLLAILEDDPDNATALNALGYTLADRNMRIPEALEYIKRAMAVSPDDPTVIDSMGWVQYRMGNYDEAEQYLRKAFNMMPDAEIAGHLSEIMWVRGNRDEALDLLQKALVKDPDHDYLLRLKRQYSR